jgi:hypothetical protein
MKLQNGHTLEKGQKVFVYRNLRNKCWSVKDKKTGLVVAHTMTVELIDATFKVSEKGRQKVLQKRQKGVHAGVEGCWNGHEINTVDGMTEITYNPYHFDSFVQKQDTATKVTEAQLVRMTDEMKVYA